MGRLVREIAQTYCEGRAVFVLEGGYDPATLATCVVQTIEGYEEAREVDATDVDAIPAPQRSLVREVEAASAGSVS
jgi:acetoin utilization deacetylase AcuC-like enzyme